ncbi:MAG: hypothetical protein WC723_06380 [Candidatus Omnitrophota bacterium]
MNKEETLVDFLKGLRIVLNNASAYPKEHPYFRKSVEVFKQRVDALFPFLNPIKIGITPNSLFIDGRFLEKLNLYTDLAEMFHLRKIKSIEFRQGVSEEELVDFLSSVSGPVREILRRGGIGNVLNREKTPRLYVEELDYSELLRDAGEESKDMWVYLFKTTVENNNLDKINEFADNFEKIIGKFNSRDLFEDAELRQSIYDFLNYLKDKEKDKFYNCTKGLLRIVLKGKNIPEKEKLDKVKVLFKSLNNEDLAETLLEAISKDENFNYLSFTVFSRLFDEDAHKAIAPTLEKEIKNEEFLKNNPRVRKKIKEVFSLPDSSFISPFYRQALSSLSEDSLPGNNFVFDRGLAQTHYRIILLNLLMRGKDIKSLDLVSGQLLKECDKAIEERDLKYLRFLWGALDNKIKEDASLFSSLEALESRISKFIENAAFEEEPPLGLEYFIDTLRKSSLGPDFYLDKIFNEGKVNPFILRLLFRFSSEDYPLFLDNLKRKHSDIELMGKIVKSLEAMDALKALEILKKMFYLSSTIIKIAVLRSMQVLAVGDSGFLLSVLDKEEAFLKREALLALTKNENEKGAALAKLFSIRSPFGRKNKILIEHMAIVEDIGLKEAAGYLGVLSKRPFFWNRDVRKKAAEVLRKWNVRKD